MVMTFRRCCGRAAGCDASSLRGQAAGEVFAVHHFPISTYWVQQPRWHTTRLVNGGTHAATFISPRRTWDATAAGRRSGAGAGASACDGLPDVATAWRLRLVSSGQLLLAPPSISHLHGRDEGASKGWIEARGLP